MAGYAMRTALIRERGFTLIEMLVALSIFASLMSVLMLGFSQGLSMWARGDDHAAIWQSWEHRYGMLSRLFAQTQVADYALEKYAYSPHFKGTSRRLEFITRAPLFDSVGAVRVVELSIEQQANNKYTLRYRQASSRSDPARGIEWDDSGSVGLLKNLRRARFRYEAPVFPLPSELDPQLMSSEERRRYRSRSEWLQRFDGGWMWRTPQRVELEFADEDGTQQQWTFVLASATDAWTLEVYSDN
jgi:prepilin-type N-terminal cleavage/methylation domain-containing protein